MSGYHAKLSPSGAKRWAICTAAPREEAGLPNTGNDASRWGTACHLLSSTCLEQGREPASYLGQVVAFFDGSDETIVPATDYTLDGAVTNVPIDEEQVACATSYVDFVRNRRDVTGGELYVEQALPIGHITGEVGATGTGDAVILTPGTLEVIDLKGGMHQVDAYDVVVPADGDKPPVLEPNMQLAMYAGGALEEYGLFADFQTVRMTIVQPRLSHVSEFEMSVVDLLAFLEKIRAGAEETRTNPTHRPGPAQCHFCKAKATCPALQAHVLEDMPDLDAISTAKPDAATVGVIYEKRGLIAKYLEAVEEFVRNQLEAGRQVIGSKGPFKLVQGKLGARHWKNPAEVEETLRKKMRLPVEQAFNMTLISPADAEKLAASDAIGKRQWKTLQTMYEQKPNKPSVVPATDPRPALAASLDDMPILTDEVDFFS